MEAIEADNMQAFIAIQSNTRIQIKPTK